MIKNIKNMKNEILQENKQQFKDMLYMLMDEQYKE